MFLGILQPGEGETFDPLVHIDMDKCTVTINAWMTNQTMRNYATSDWSSLRDELRMVPLSHPYWRVDPSLGDAMWKGTSDETITPIRPAPAFSMPLMPITPWIHGPDGNLAFSIFKCEHCTARFDTPGTATMKIKIS
ncbi:hypothetical protein V8C44DRAFT_361122 [Trichoderma aethiopicum]